MFNEIIVSSTTSLQPSVLATQYSVCLFVCAAWPARGLLLAEKANVRQVKKRRTSSALFVVEFE